MRSIDGIGVGTRVRILEDVTGDRIFRHVEKGDIGTVKAIFFNEVTNKFGFSVAIDWFEEYELESQILDDEDFDLEEGTYDFYMCEVEKIKEEY